MSPAQIGVLAEQQLAEVTAERDHYRRIVLEEYPKERAEFAAKLADEKERTVYFMRVFDEACIAARFTCPLCCEPYAAGDGPWRCRECDIDRIGTGVAEVPLKVPQAALERDRALAAARELREALADMVNQHGGEETCLSANESAVDALEQTKWLDEVLP